MIRNKPNTKADLRSQEEKEMKRFYSTALRMVLALAAMVFIILSMIYDVEGTKFLTIGFSFLTVANILNCKTMCKFRKNKSEQE